jgi:type IV pilus assembly protein PilA
MAKLLKKKSGFTLIELMIVVAILGILAAVAVPAFLGYMRRAKTAEVTVNLNNMFKLAASYYENPRNPRDLTNQVGASQCVVVATAAREPVNPGPTKQPFVETNEANGTFVALGFTISDLVYYSYSVASAPLGASANCLLAGETFAADTVVYTLRANGDLDDDTTESLFELAIKADQNAQLSRAIGFYINNETE